MGFGFWKCAVCGEQKMNVAKVAKSHAWCCNDCLRKAKEISGILPNVWTTTIEEISDIITGNTDPKKYEFRKRCNVCGKVYCFTNQDLRDNAHRLKESRAYAAGSLFTPMVMAGSYVNEANRKLDSVVDYNRCPYCNSIDVTDISEEEFKQLQSGRGSMADELKKYKELLDNGAITQEEFNEKKKQLFGGMKRSLAGT